MRFSIAIASFFAFFKMGPDGKYDLNVVLTAAGAFYTHP